MDSPLPAAPVPAASLNTSPAPATGLIDKGLRSNTLGLMRIVVLGLAATAPAYSLAVTLGYVVDAVGVYAPGAFLVGFIPILFTAIAIRELNRAMPDCGGGFVWVTRALGPLAGWFFSGWVPQIATFIATAALAQVATVYLLNTVGLTAVADNPVAVTIIAVVLIAVSAFISARGIQVSSWIQYALMALQILALVGFCVGAFIAMGNGTAPAAHTPPAFAWLNLFAADPSAIVAGVILALFIYWGWDALISVNEESTHRARTPGRAVIVATVILVLLYTVTSVATLGYGGVDLLTSPKVIGDVFSALAPSATGEIFGRIVTLAVGLSALACLFTVAITNPRGFLSMAAYKALPQGMAKVHSTRLTPVTATYWWAALSIVTFLGLKLISEDFIGLAVTSIGLMVAASYGICGVTSIVYFAPQMRDRAALWRAGILPGIGAALMFAAFIYSAFDMARPDYAGSSWLGIGTVFWIGIGTFIIGIPVVLIARRMLPDYFQGRTIPRGNSNSPEFELLDPAESSTN